MCFDIANEQGARNWVNELVRAYKGPSIHARDQIVSFQKNRGWLLDYDLETCQPKAGAVAESNPVPVDTAEVSWFDMTADAMRRTIDEELTVFITEIVAAHERKRKPKVDDRKGMEMIINLVRDARELERV